MSRVEGLLISYRHSQFIGTNIACSTASEFACLMNNGIVDGTIMFEHISGLDTVTDLVIDLNVMEALQLIKNISSMLSEKVSGTFMVRYYAFLVDCTQPNRIEMYVTGFNGTKSVCLCNIEYVGYAANTSIFTGINSLLCELRLMAVYSNIAGSDKVLNLKHYDGVMFRECSNNQDNGEFYVDLSNEQSAIFLKKLLECLDDADEQHYHSFILNDYHFAVNTMYDMAPGRKPLKIIDLYILELDERGDVEDIVGRYRYGSYAEGKTLRFGISRMYHSILNVLPVDTKEIIEHSNSLSGKDSWLYNTDSLD